jgi:hypothetical protein
MAIYEFDHIDTVDLIRAKELLKDLEEIFGESLIEEDF